MAGWSHRYAKINGLDVHYVEQGTGPLVVLLHGFPHTWFSWRHQIGPIADAGFRVVDVWNSREEFEAFIENTIGPLAAQVGIPGPPSMQFFEVHNYFTAGG